MGANRNRRRKKKVLTPNQPLTKYGLISFNSIGYGNPTINQHLQMKKGGLLDDILDDIDKDFPSNESDETLSELKYIKTKLKRLEARETYEECVAIDLDLKRYISEICKETGVPDVSSLIDDVESSFLNSLVFKLKFKYNRARPGQLSFYYVNQDELNPLKSTSSMSPSYPSGHTLEVYVITDILAHHFPEHKEVFDKIKKRVAISRILIGAHYPSDNEFSLEIASLIKESPIIKNRYYDNNWDKILKIKKNETK
jgi:hypothetical protein